MPFTMRRAALLLASAAILPQVPALAESQWVKARLGSFETISDTGRHSAVQALSQFEQFRFALGAVMGKPDLKLDPPLRIVVFRDAKEMPQECSGLHAGRDHLMACVVSPEESSKDPAKNQLPPELVRQLTVRLLEENFSNLPIPIERALESFFSTVQSNSVHVTWGAPPPRDERTREWALIQMMITQPEYSGRAHIYLHNLANGMDSNGAIRSLSEDPAKFNAAVDAYYVAGAYKPVQAPNRVLNADRDFRTTVLTSDEGELARADLLTSESASLYQSLLKSGKHVPEANEGLAILAFRAHDFETGRRYMEAARTAGTQNAIALTEYGRAETDPERAITILKEALTIDPKYADAHWALGEKIADKPRRLAEWKQATALAPRRYDWWEQYAKLCIDQKQYAEAGRAWLAAAQSAPDPEHREQYLASRGAINQLRLDDEEAERRRDIAARNAEMNRLKDQARRELAALEARANSHPLSKEEAAKAVDWADIHGSGSVTGTLSRVQCQGRQYQLEIKDELGKTTRLFINDPSQVELSGPDPTLTCNQAPRSVIVTFKASADKKGFAGEATGIDYH
jgi:hypothetical protein